MTPTVRKFGAFVSAQVPRRPKAARRLLSTAYSLVSWKSGHLPDRADPTARSLMNQATGRCMSACLRHPERAALVNIFFPCELLYALDLLPMAPETLACYVTNTACEGVFLQAAEDRGVPETYCSYHRTLLGMAESGVLPAPRLILNTSMVCDANQLTFRRLADFYGVPHRTVEVPYEGGPDAEEFVARQLRDLVPALEEAAGKRLDPQRLQEAVARSKRSLEWYDQYLALRADRSVSDSMSGELLGVMNNYILLGSPESERCNRRLAQELARTPKGLRGKRLLWLHTLPNWQDAVKGVVDRRPETWEIVAGDMTLSTLVELDPQRPYHSMARRLVGNFQRGAAQERIAADLAWAKRLHIDGAVVFCHWGCKQTLGLALQAKRAFEAAGLPTLALDGDGCDPRNASDGQMVTRLAAFLEQLEAKP